MSTIVGQGCVGECGQSASIEYIVKTRGAAKLVVKTVETSLCGNTGAMAFIFVNGREVAKGAITDKGANLKTMAKPGSRVAVYVATYPIPNGISCIRLGELKFDLIENEQLMAVKADEKKQTLLEPKAEMIVKKEKKGKKEKKEKKEKNKNKVKISKKAKLLKKASALVKKKKKQGKKGKK